MHPMLVFPKAKQYLLQNCDTYHKTVDIFGPDLRSDMFRTDKGSPLAFSHSLHQQAGILEVFLALTFRPREESYSLLYFAQNFMYTLWGGNLYSARR